MRDVLARSTNTSRRVAADVGEQGYAHHAKDHVLARAGMQSGAAWRRVMRRAGGVHELPVVVGHIVLAAFDKFAEQRGVEAVRAICGVDQGPVAGARVEAAAT